MMALFLFGVLFFFTTVPPAFSQEAMTISWDFENGSLGSWESVDERNILLTHAPDAGGLWYYFRVDNVKGKTLTFIFENARKDYYDDISVPAISYDQKQWFFCFNRTILPQKSDPNLIHYSFTHTFVKKRAWIAYAPPFTNTMLNREIMNIEAHPHADVLSLCDTAIEQQTLPLVYITDPENERPKKTILVLGREEAYESATSWFSLGIIRFLLSEDPLAASIRRRSHFFVVPIFDRDGVTAGKVIHPMPNGQEDIFWSETWMETKYSFHEQRQMKHYLQTWKNKGNEVDLAFRVHSETWEANRVQPEHCSQDNLETQKTFMKGFLVDRYFPWFEMNDRLEMDTRFSKYIHDLFPNAITALIQTDFVYRQVLNQYPYTYKTINDLLFEGELFARAVGEWLGVKGDPAPYLHAIQLGNWVANKDKPVPIQCIYRDVTNRKPKSVQAILNEQAYNLKPLAKQTEDVSKGVLFHGFLPITQEENHLQFRVSTEVSLQTDPTLPVMQGPYLNPDQRKNP